MISNEKLDFWIKHNQNVLMIGEKGVGKTHLAIDAFKRNKLRFKYFSGPTLDPFVDLLGCPREKKGNDGVSYLDFIQPRELAHDEVDCIFVDEISRAHYKVKNAILELIQFRSINGRKFNNLRFVWAAMNPPDSSHRYQVEELDDAQWDRFQVHVKLDYKPDVKYFIGKFGAEKAKAACEWWTSIDKKFNHLVSPRRLDYALVYHGLGGDLRDILPSDVNVTELNKLLGTGPIMDRLKDIAAKNNVKEAQKIVADSNLYAVAEKYIKTDETYLSIFLPLLPDEKAMTLFGENNTKITSFFTARVSEEKAIGKGKYIDMMRDIIKANTSDGLTLRAKRVLDCYSIPHVAIPENLNDEMSKVQKFLGDEPFINQVKNKKVVYNSIVSLYEGRYHEKESSNCEALLAAALVLCNKIKEKDLGKDGDFVELPDICMSLHNKITKPVDLYKKYGFTEKSLAKAMELPKRFEVPF